MTAFIVGAYTFALGAPLVLLATYFCTRRANQDDGRRRILVSALAVAFVTAAVNFVHAQDLGTAKRPGDGVTQYWLEWAGYSVSLVFIGDSLLHFLAPAVPGDVTLHGGVLLGVTGLGGLAGLLVDSGHRGTQWAVLVLTTAAYALWIAYAAQLMDTRRYAHRILTIAGFILATLFYVVSYVAGPPVYAGITADTEHWVYFVGNVLTKLVLPVFELMWFTTAAVDFVPAYAAAPAVTARTRLQF